MGDIYDDIDNILNGTDTPETSAELADAMVDGMLDEDKNFNEAELQDIMSEIESLEKEFEGTETIMAAPLKKDPVMEELMESAAEAEMIEETFDEAVFDEGELDAVLMDTDVEETIIAEPTPVAVATNNPLQDVIERELAESLLKEKAEEIRQEIHQEEKKVHVLNFDKPAPKTTPTTTPTTTKGSEVAFSAQGSMALTLDFKVGTENAKLTIDPTKGLTVTLAGVELVINETEGCHVVMENGMKFSIPLSSLEKSVKKAA